MAGLTGLEPATSCVTGRRSNQAELQPLAGKGKAGRKLPSLCHKPLNGAPFREAKRGRIVPTPKVFVNPLKDRNWPISQ